MFSHRRFFNAASPLPGVRVHNRGPRSRSGPGQHEGRGAAPGQLPRPLRLHLGEGPSGGGRAVHGLRVGRAVPRPGRGAPGARRRSARPKPGAGGEARGVVVRQAVAAPQAGRVGAGGGGGRRQSEGRGHAARQHVLRHVVQAGKEIGKCAG